MLDVHKFIAAYKNEKCLWDISHEDYANVHMRREALAGLMNEFRVSGK